MPVTPHAARRHDPLLMRGYRGAVDVVEQVSPEGGRMAVTGPKMGKTRRVFLSPLLYPAWDRDAQRSLRDLLTDPHNANLPPDGFNVFDPTSSYSSLWDMTEGRRTPPVEGGASSPSHTSSTIDSARCGSSPIGTSGSSGTPCCSLLITLPGNAAPGFPSPRAGHTRPGSPMARTSRLQTSPTATWRRSTTTSRRLCTSGRATRERADVAGHTTT